MIQSTLNLLRESLASQNNTVLAGILKLIKETMIYRFKEEQFQQLILLKDSIPEECGALYIETLVEYPHFSVDEALLDEYIQCIATQQTYVEDAIRCLDNMSSIGMKEETIFQKIVDQLDEQYALFILTPSTICLKQSPADCMDVYEKVKRQRNIYKRSFFVSTFLLIVHPFLDEYIEISAIKFAYSSAESAILDKGWYYADHDTTLIQDKVLNAKEVELLKELGEEFARNHTLHSEKANELYYSFFGDTSPIDVMLTLHE